MHETTCVAGIRGAQGWRSRCVLMTSPVCSDLARPQSRATRAAPTPHHTLTHAHAHTHRSTRHRPPNARPTLFHWSSGPPTHHDPQGAHPRAGAATWPAPLGRGTCWRCYFTRAGSAAAGLQLHARQASGCCARPTGRPLRRHPKGRWRRAARPWPLPGTAAPPHPPSPPPCCRRPTQAAAQQQPLVLLRRLRRQPFKAAACPRRGPEAAVGAGASSSSTHPACAYGMQGQQCLQLAPKQALTGS